MVLAEGDIDELIEFWTLLDEDRELLVGRRGPSALGFALLLKISSRGPATCVIDGSQPTCGAAFPQMRRLSRSNLSYMRSLAAA